LLFATLANKDAHMKRRSDEKADCCECVV